MKLISRKELADKLGCSVRTVIRRERRNPRIKSAKVTVGGQVRYDWDKIEKVLFVTVCRSLS